MVRLALVFATAALGARIKLEDAGDQSLAAETDLASELQDGEELILEEGDADDVGEPEEAPVGRCSDSVNDPRGRRRGRRDCGCLSNGHKACYVDDPGDQCSWQRGSSGIGHYCRRRRSAPRPPPPPRRPPPPPPPPPAYISGSGRFWLHGSHASAGTASSPGYLPNGWYDPNSEFMRRRGEPDHSGDPYPLAAMTRPLRDARGNLDPHHCFHGWAACCNNEFNCCANCPYQNPDRPEWGPRGFSACLSWFPECGTDAPHPNMPAPAPPPEFHMPNFSMPSFHMPSFGGFGGGGDDDDSEGGGGGFHMPSFGGLGGGGGDDDSESGGGGFHMPSFGGFGGGGDSSPDPAPGPAPESGGGFGGFGGGGFGGFR